MNTEPTRIGGTYPGWLASLGPAPEPAVSKQDPENPERNLALDSHATPKTRGKRRHDGSESRASKAPRHSHD